MLTKAPEVRMIVVPEMNHFVPWTDRHLIVEAVQHHLDGVLDNETDAADSPPIVRASP
jgi:hypothetical protein